MNIYTFILLACFLVVSVGLFLELKLLLRTKKTLLVLAILLIMLIVSGGIGYAGSSVTGKLISYEDDLAKIKQTPIDDLQTQQILDQLPSELKFNKDFEDANKLLKELEERLDQLKSQNKDLNDENSDLEDEIDDLMDEIEDLQTKVNAIGVVVGVY